MMNLPRTAGFDTDLDRLLRSTFGGFTPRRAAVGVGAMTVSEKDGRYLVEVDLPGFEMADLEISLMENELRMRGERTVTEHEDAVYHLRSTRKTKLDETLRFPVEIDPESVDAVLAAGVLTVTLKKSAETQPRRIEVRQVAK